MITCSTCGHQNRAGRKFCGACGAALALACASCGTPYDAGEKFCGECGAEVKVPDEKVFGVRVFGVTELADPLTANTVTPNTLSHGGDRNCRARAAAGRRSARATCPGAGSPRQRRAQGRGEGRRRAPSRARPCPIHGRSLVRAADPRRTGRPRRPTVRYRWPPAMVARSASAVRRNGRVWTRRTCGADADALLAAVAELPERDLREALARLRSGEFLHEKSVYPVAEYSFKHPLTQAVAADSLLAERRHSLHAAVARALESYGGNLDEQAALLAHHWSEAGEAQPAALWHRRAAEWIAGRNSGEATRHWQRVRELADEISDPALANQLGIRARVMILEHAWRRGVAQQEVDELQREGEEWARRQENPCDRVPRIARRVGATTSRCCGTRQGVARGTTPASGDGCHRSCGAAGERNWLMNNPTPCFDWLGMSGSPPEFGMPSPAHPELVEGCFKGPLG